jgi:accessory gene regulator protein AgrB
MLSRYKLDNERFCGFKLVQYEVEKSLVCTILPLLFIILSKWCWMCIAITALVSILYSKS